MHHRSDIDGLRAVAVIPVLLFHAGLGLGGGFVGVDVFFVISGYLLSGIVMQEIHERRFSYVRFYERRFRRLMPALFAMLLVSGLVFSRTMLPEDFAAFARSACATLLVYSNLHFYATIDYFSQSALLMPLLHTWSLSIEEQFYALLPVLLILLHRRLGPRVVPVALWLLFGVSFALCLYYTQAYKPKAFYMPYTRAWELLAGALIHVLPASPLRRGVREVLGAGSLAALGAMFVLLDERSAFPGVIALGPVLATACLLWCGAQAPTTWAARTLSLAPLVFVGRISYSLYLWHWPVLVFARYGDLAPESLATRLACLAAAFVLATLSWRFVEEPFRRKRLLAGTWPYLGATLGATTVALGLSALILARNGLPERLDAQTRVLLDESRHATPRPECFPDASAVEHFTPCTGGAPDRPPSFFLVGDSHGHALSPALFEAARRAGMSGLEFASPGFLPGPGRHMLGGSEDARIAQAMRQIREHPELEVVVMACAWPDYAIGRNWKDSSWLYQDDLSVAHDSHDNVPIFERSLRRLVRAFPDRRFVLLDDVPAGAELDLHFHARRMLTHSPEVAAPLLPATKVAQRRAVYDPILARLAAEEPNVAYVRVFDGLCPAEGCPLFRDGVALYRDGDHLSGSGALALAGLFLERVIPQLGAGRPGSP